MAEVEQRLRRLVLADPSPEIGMALGVGGLNRNFAATIKSGKHVPHAMRWDALRHITSATRH